jgi:endonuclease YncB( thermonuclease family)
MSVVWFSYKTSYPPYTNFSRGRCLIFIGTEGVASRYTQKKLIGKYVNLEFEIKKLRGNYGRLLAYVFVDGQNLNLDLVRQGLSPYYTKYGKSEKYDAEFRAVEKQARKEELNIWGDPELTKKYLRLKSKWGQYEK